MKVYLGLLFTQEFVHFPAQKTEMFLIYVHDLKLDQLYLYDRS